MTELFAYGAGFIRSLMLKHPEECFAAVIKIGCGGRI